MLRQMSCATAVIFVMFFTALPGCDGPEEDEPAAAVAESPTEPSEVAGVTQHAATDIETAIQQADTRSLGAATGIDIATTIEGTVRAEAANRGDRPRPRPEPTDPADAPEPEQPQPDCYSCPFDGNDFWDQDFDY